MCSAGTDLREVRRPFPVAGYPDRSAAVDLPPIAELAESVLAPAIRGAFGRERARMRPAHRHSREVEAAVDQSRSCLERSATVAYFPMGIRSPAIESPNGGDAAGRRVASGDGHKRDRSSNTHRSETASPGHSLKGFCLGLTFPGAEGLGGSTELTQVIQSPAIRSTEPDDAACHIAPGVDRRR